LLYELLAGSTPFDPRELMSQGIHAMRKTIREKEPQRPSTRFAPSVQIKLPPRPSAVPPTPRSCCTSSRETWTGS
jgi:hypothetical protein